MTMPSSFEKNKDAHDATVGKSHKKINRRKFGIQISASALLASSAGIAHSAEDAPKPIVDTHMHVWADDAKKYPYVHPYAPNFIKPTHPGSTEMLLADMDAAGCTHSILVQVIYHGWDNTYVAESVRQAPDRLKAHGLIDPTDPKVADKLTYWMTEHPLSGMRFSPIYYFEGNHGGDAWLTSQAHHKLWKQAEKLGAVFNYFIDTRQLGRLQEMVQRYPGVNVIVDHLSQMNLGAEDPEPEFKKLLAIGKFPNVYVKVSELSSVSKSQTYPFSDAWPWVKRVYEAFGPDRLLWGTGYPGSARKFYNRPSLIDEIALVQQEFPFLSQADRAKILGYNAARLWGLT